MSAGVTQVTPVQLYQMVQPPPRAQLRGQSQFARGNRLPPWRICATSHRIGLADASERRRIWLPSTKAGPPGGCNTERPLTRAMESTMTQAVINIATPSKQIVSRRIAITGMCAAVAVPAGAAAAVCAAPDPVYAAMAEWKKADAFHRQCLSKADDIEVRHFDERREMEAVAEANKAEVAVEMRRLLKLPDLSQDDAVKVITQIYTRHLDEGPDGIEIERLRSAGHEAEASARDAMLATVPTTKAGALALVTFLHADSEKGHGADIWFDEDTAPQFSIDAEGISQRGV